ncbi:MAG: sigma-70 family RNA polymerase sigma factor [Clostridia bacterium]|nr:sigma-70 family RNA polymerase sigma factor [Clostridia bacterium]
MNTLYNQNAGFVKEIAREAHRLCGDPAGTNYYEMYQEAGIAFVEAVYSFEPEKGFRFLTYAGRCVRNRVIDWLRGESEGKSDLCYNDNIATRKVNEIDESIRTYFGFSELSQSAETIFFRQYFVETIESALTALTPRQARYIEYRFGFSEEQAHPRAACARHFGISYKDAEKTEAAALEAMRAICHQRLDYIERLQNPSDSSRVK